MKKEKKDIYFKYIIISILICAIAFLTPIPNIIKLILCIISFILLSYRKYIQLGKKKKYLPLYSLFYLIALILIDSICVVTLSKTPIFSLNIINNDNIRVYKGIGYKAWQCDKKNKKDLIIEPFYKKGYVCSIEDIDNISINDLITSLNNNYESYRNTYVKVTGKISKKNGQNYVEMQSYTKSNEELNGYVEFSTTITLAILFQDYHEQLDILDIYDEITVVGQIKNMETTNDSRIIYMSEAKLVSNIETNDYRITASSLSSKKINDATKNLIYETNSNKIYTYGLKNIVINFNNELNYELASALSSKKIDINDIIKDAKEIIKDEKDLENKNVLYKFDTYNIIVCDESQSKDILITSTKIKLKDAQCALIVE